MSNQTTPSAGQLPGYITSAVPNPKANRAPWYKNTAPTYAGIFLWFVFWQDAVNAPNAGGMLSQGVGWALLSLVMSAVVCHFLFYLVPGLLGMKTGLPLYIVGTSTFGARGGFLMPGFLMGVLQFGWVGVNVYFSALALAKVIPLPPQVLMVIWGVLAAFVGLKGIQYVAKVATYLPLIPLAILLMLLAKTAGSIGSFDAPKLIELHKGLAPQAPAALSTFGVLAFMMTFVVGFFATAGAAGVDFGLNSRDGNDVKMGGLVGVALAIFVTAGISLLFVAGTFGSQTFSAKAAEGAKVAIVKAVDKEVASAKEAATKSGKNLTEDEIKKLTDDVTTKTAQGALFQSPSLIPALVGEKLAGILMFLLAAAAFPSVCFSAFIAANSFKTTLPKVNPFISVGIGTTVSIILAITGVVAKAISVFVIIGASFGPICGAMLVDYLLSGRKWSGPRAGFNPAGWIAWAAGFVVGILPNLDVNVPAAPVLAFVVGAVVFFLCAKMGMQSSLVPVSGALAEATK
ncbi:MAG: cytosine permease [Verrucomicrobiota bacterium]